MSLGVQERRASRRFSETATTVLEALVIALVIRSFLFQPFNIPSGSMSQPSLSVTICSLQKLAMASAVTPCRSRRPYFRAVFWRRRRSAATSSFFATDRRISSNA